MTHITIPTTISSTTPRPDDSDPGGSSGAAGLAGAIGVVSTGVGVGAGAAAGGQLMSGTLGLGSVSEANIARIRSSPAASDKIELQPLISTPIHVPESVIVQDMKQDLSELIRD